MTGYTVMAVTTAIGGGENGNGNGNGSGSRSGTESAVGEGGAEVVKGDVVSAGLRKRGRENGEGWCLWMIGLGMGVMLGW